MVQRDINKNKRKKTSRERILLYGREDTGKTYSWLTIAATLPDVTFYCIDTDDTTERMLEDEFNDVQNVDAILVNDWSEFRAETLDVIEEINETQDKNTPREELPWLVVDMADVTWDWVQGFFTEEAFDQDIDQYFLEARKEQSKKSGKLNPFEGWTDWQVINRLFQKIWVPLTRGKNYHLLLTAKVQDVAGAKETKDLYQELGNMPAGEKRMGHRVHTILQMKNNSNGWFMATAKDRGRDHVMGVPIEDFAQDYLKDVAGWEF